MGNLPLSAWHVLCLIKKVRIGMAGMFQAAGSTRPDITLLNISTGDGRQDPSTLAYQKIHVLPLLSGNA